MALPRKRYGIDVFPIEHEGQPLFVVRDAEGVIDDGIGLPLIVGLVWDLLDGRRAATDIQDFIAEHARGVKIPSEAIERIVRQLDEIYLLDTDRLQARRREIREEFGRAVLRPARFAGKGGYASEATELEKELERYYAGDFGAGHPDRGAHAPLRGALAPHIDFHRGGSCYTHAYRRIAEAQPADVYLVLGVAHASPEPPFIPTIKSYDTPLGAADIDRDFVEALLKRTKRAGLDHELTHRTEHSAEFQAVFLRHARRQTSAFTFVPVLCSAFERHCGEKSPSTAAIIEDYIGALRETITGCGRTVCIIGGVDLAHVGPRFGDRVAVDERLIERMTEGDKKSLAAIAAGDPEGFWASVMDEGNWRKVCGLSAIYTTLRLLEGARGELLRYTYAPDPAGGLVSFAAAAFS
ncbi:MAG: AmmeMemoRadiSam system protein B [Planctomycetes bacterium]|nr:AmmeMemoRadiSam system protein B [Planctomycetota bacterium]